MQCLPKAESRESGGAEVGQEVTTRPGIVAVVRHLSLAILVAQVIPSALFWTAMVAGDVWLALIVALVWCYAATGWRYSTGRRASGLLWLTVIAMTAKTAFAFASGSTFVYFLQPAVTEMVIAGGFAVSLLTARPVVSRLAADFYPMDDETAARPRVQQLFWRLTLVWATLLATKAVVALWLLHSVSLTSYVTAKSAMNPAAAVIGATVTVLLAARVARREGLLPARRPALAASPA